MRRLISISFFFIFTIAISQVQTRRGGLVNYVNPLIGTGHNKMQPSGIYGKGTEELGQTLPAVLVPNGMNAWTPQTRNTEKKCVAPYYYEDNRFLGFRNSHWIVGGCTQDYGSMTITPQFERLRMDENEKGTRFSHNDEISQPNYYSVSLKDEQIKAEMTGRSRSAIFKFTYQKGGKAYFVITSNSDEHQGYVGYDKVRNIIYGWNPVHRIYQGLGESAGFSGHFVIELPAQPVEFGLFEQGAWVCFHVKKNETLMIKAASSFCDLDGAIKNLKTEIPHWDFNRTLTETTNEWDRHLGRIEIAGNNYKEKERFYTAFYHASFLPRMINDVDGRRPKFDNSVNSQIIKNNCPYYTDFSLWDTYRALHPFLNILSPELNGTMMQSLVDMYKEGGWLPIFPCWNSYTAAMIGDHAISVITDAYIKGVRNFDVTTAYQAMHKNAFEVPKKQEDYKNGKGRRALESYLKYDYIPLEEPVEEAFHKQEQVSRTLEYAYDDYCLAQMALALEEEKDYNSLIKRSKNYKHVLNGRTGYVQGRSKKGRFLTEFNATERTRFITEGAPCHYTWYVPHDPYGLMKAMGGKKEYILRLDSMFSEKRYWHGNEPCHQVPYMYNYAGEPWKTQLRVRQIINAEYGNDEGGLSGNDDAGQMSAWYLFSSLGFYPVCPGTPFYMIGSPLHTAAKIHLPNGRSFEIIAHNQDENNVYIQSAKFNGQPYTKNYITHQMIMTGGVLEFEMGPQPNIQWGASTENCPPKD